MNVKSMLVGLLIAVVASMGTYFLMPPPRGAEAARCVTSSDFHPEIISLSNRLENSINQWGTRNYQLTQTLRKELVDARVIKNPFTDYTPKN